MGMIGRFRETLGQYLRRERESRSLSLEELSKATRIGQVYLEALERDDFNFFSQKEFILGFLKGYARSLGLNTDEVLARYRTQSELASRKENFRQMHLFPGSGVEENDPDPESEPVLAPPRRPRRFPWKIVLQIVILAAALALSWYLHQLLKNPDSGAKSSSEVNSLGRTGRMEHSPEKRGSLASFCPREIMEASVPLSYAGFRERKEP